MGRKPKKGLREAILAEASEKPSSATMIREALGRHRDAEPTTLTGVIKAAERLREAGMLEASEAMPESYRGARTRTYYTATKQGLATLRETIANATAGWNAPAPAPAAPAPPAPAMSAPSPSRAAPAAAESDTHDHDARTTERGADSG